MPEKVSWEAIGSSTSVPFLSPAYKSNGHVFTSGNVGSKSDGSIPEDLEEQTELAIKNLITTLEKSGSSIDKVLKVLLFIGHPTYSAVVNKVYTKYFTTAPARSCVVVSFPNPSIKVELECVAEYQDLSKL